MRKSVVVQLLVSVALLLFTPIMGQSGLNDDAFNPDDIGFGYGSGPNGVIYTSVLQQDGKIIIGGVLTEYDNALSPCIARINPDGSRDASFMVGEGASGGNASVRSLLIQKDYKILVAGTFQSFHSESMNGIARINSNGTLDTKFVPELGTGSSVLCTAVQSDGKILVGGVLSVRGANPVHLARLNANGSLDTTFNIGVGPNQRVLALVVQPDDKVIVAGEFTVSDTLRSNYLVRLNADGSTDSTFVVKIGPDKRIVTAALQSDGKILIAGDFTAYDGSSRGRIARLHVDGSLDETFGLSTGANNTINAMFVQEDGRVVIGGSFTSVNGKTMNYVSRLNSEGSLDPTINVAIGPNNVVHTLAVQTDLRTVIGGAFTTYNGVTRNYVARLNANGSLNLPFNQGTGASLTVNTTALQPDGKIIMAGNFTAYNGATKNRVMRLHNDGKVDVTFNIGTGVDASIYTSLIQPDGKIVVGGDFTKYNELKINSLARLNQDGTIDTSFHIGAGPRKNISTTQIKVVLASAL
ncbi:MAG TPA: delta-60 repeat domain-containing protein, partial [Cytophagales bacterium]|nr:delta-60 repeat domain-containing protein [Cytophagales bacterium]